ncbi:MAG: GAF domain-containing protein, partial [Dehalococcoidia bacterium]|nr:GAF domain-containing protein [Dehalococcoidia bacterium]
MTDYPHGRGAPGDAGWIILRDDLEVVAADDVARALIGTPQPDALTGRRLTSLVAVSDAASLDSARAAAASGRAWEGRLRFTATLTPVELEASLTPAPQVGMALLRLALPRYATQASPQSAGDPALRARLDAHEALLEVTPDAPAARAVLQALRQVVPFDWAAVLRFTDGSEGHTDARPGAEIVGVYPSAMAGMAPGVRWSPLTPEEARVREDGEPSLTNDLPAAGRSPLGRLGAFGMRSRLLIPLYAGQRVVGCVAAYLHGPAVFSPQDGIHAEATLRPLGARIAATPAAAEAEVPRTPAEQHAPVMAAPEPSTPVVPAPAPPPPPPVLAVPPVATPPTPTPTP